ncbi:hypothetical protein GGS20DRAFT_558208, partial [Poronia punctata]
MRYMNGRVTHFAVVGENENENENEEEQEEEQEEEMGINPAVIRSILKKQAGVENAKQEKIWIPEPEHQQQQQQQQSTKKNSGLQTYTIISQLLERTGLIVSRGGGFLPYLFFAPLRPWFNPATARAEALGHAAMYAMKQMRFRVRLGLFPIGDFFDG